MSANSRFLALLILTGLLAGSFLFGTAACQETNSSNAAKVMAAKVKPSLASEKKVERKAQDEKLRSKNMGCFDRLSEKEKEKMKIRGQRVVLIMSLLTQSHNLFKQSLACIRHISDDRKKCWTVPDENSPFLEIYKDISLLYDSEGFVRCEKIDSNYRLLFTDNGSGEEVQLVLGKKGFVAKFEFLEQNLINLQMDKILLKKGFGVLFSGAFEFTDKNSEKYIGQQIKSCKMSYHELALTELNCPGVGQDADQNHYYEFTEFSFKANDANPLNLTVEKRGFKIDDRTTIFRGAVPLIGNIIMQVIGEREEIEAEKSAEKKTDENGEKQNEEKDEKQDEKKDDSDQKNDDTDDKEEVVAEGKGPELGDDQGDNQKGEAEKNHEVDASGAAEDVEEQPVSSRKDNEKQRKSRAPKDTEKQGDSKAEDAPSEDVQDKR